MNRKLIFTSLLVLTVLLTACGGSPPMEPVPEEPAAEEAVPEAAPVEPAPTAEPEPTANPEPDFEPLPADAQRMEFQAEDGTTLVGYYYPAAVADAPVVLLMHWARGDQNDWIKNGMVDWLQNRDTIHGTNAPSRQSLIYPPMPDDISFAVFTFDFRGFGESSGDFTHDGGLIDAKTAYEFIKTLAGVDPTRIAGVGSSIGADGVVDGCGEGCLGALSLSPGSYLDVPYAEAVKVLDDQEKPITCVASEGDPPSATACEAAIGEYYEKVLYSGNAHGDMYFQNTPEGFGDMVFDWLMRVFEIEG